MAPNTCPKNDEPSKTSTNTNTATTNYNPVDVSRKISSRHNQNVDTTVFQKQPREDIANATRHAIERPLRTFHTVSKIRMLTPGQHDLPANSWIFVFGTVPLVSATADGNHWLLPPGFGHHLTRAITMLAPTGNLAASLRDSEENAAMDVDTKLPVHRYGCFW